MLWPLSVSLNFWPAMLHIFIVLSSDAVSNVVESGEKDTHRTPPVCALMTLERPLLMLGAHRRTVRSLEPEAISPFASEKATECTLACNSVAQSSACAVSAMWRRARAHRAKLRRPARVRRLRHAPCGLRSGTRAARA